MARQGLGGLVAVRYPAGPARIVAHEIPEARFHLGNLLAIGRNSADDYRVGTRRKKQDHHPVKMPPRLTSCLFLASLLILSACGESDTQQSESDAQPGGLCVGVVCTTPPANSCKNQSTLLIHDPKGTCNPRTGQCEYPSSEKPCGNGCAQASCQASSGISGWISVLELNGAYLNAPWDWMGGMRAYFAAQPHWLPALEHQRARHLTKVATKGSCTFYRGSLDEIDDVAACSPPCATDKICMLQNGQHGCQALPEHYDLGTITIKGLKQAITLKQDTFNRYSVANEPTDLFDKGSTVSLTASGGSAKPFTLSAKGVADLTIANDTVELSPGTPATVSWTPADPGSRIQVLLSTGPHNPYPPLGLLLCDAADSDGKVGIAAELVDGFIEQTHKSCICRFSHVTRYIPNVQSPAGLQVELFLGSVRLLKISVKS